MTFNSSTSPTKTPPPRRRLGRAMSWLLALLVGTYGLLRPAPTARASTYTVTTFADSGTGSLREAITLANLFSDADVINFNLPTGIDFVLPTSPLPAITNPVLIFGETQPGSYCDSDFPRDTKVGVRLLGSAAGAGAVGFDIRSNNVRVSGFSVEGFSSHGIVVQDADDVLIACNFIGTDKAGAAAAANGGSGIRMFMSANLPLRNQIVANVVSGNLSHGIEISASSQITIEKNVIGTDLSGSAAIKNGSNGIYLAGASGSNTQIAIRNNVVSGNALSGILVESSLNNTIQSNKIGTNISGTAALANLNSGIYLRNSANNTIGGNSDSLRNIASGNQGYGVVMFGSSSNNNTVSRNFIGTDSGGTLAIPNTSGGVVLSNNALQNTIGSNVISGNSFDGIGLVNANNNQIIGNFVGAKVNGAQALANSGQGINLVSSTGNYFGSNLVSGNAGVGIQVYGAHTNTLEGNYIGTNVTGTVALPNGSHGISLTFGTSNNLIRLNYMAGNLGNGVSIDSANNNQFFRNRIGLGVGNVALGNQAAGVLIVNSANNKIGDLTQPPNFIANNVKGIWINNPTSVGNQIAANYIYSNTGLGIDLSPTGVTPNDVGDADTGPNNLQNNPVLTSVVSSGASTVITGLLNSTPSTPFIIEFFSNAVVEGDGICEGAIFVGSAYVTTTISGDVSFSTTLPSVVPVGYKLSATARNLNTADTSEFSACTTVTGISPPSPVVSLSPVTRTVNEGAGVATFTVQLSISTSVPVTVNYSAASNLIPGPTDATPGSDYVSVTNQSLVIPTGQLSATFSISIVNDTLAEPSENFLVSIELPAGSIATLDNSKANSVVTIVDNDVANTPPVANAQTVTTKVGAAKAITLTGSDADSNALTFSIVAQPLNGILTGTAPNLIYTPNASFVGNDSFTFKVNDGTADSAVATIRIVVTTTLPPPVANAQTVTTTVGTAKAITLTGSTVNGNALAFAIVATPTQGTLSGTAPALIYTPNAGFVGNDSFTFKVNDGAADSAVATISIAVTATPPSNLNKKVYLPYATKDGDPVFVGAGDIADCALPDDANTANLLDGINGTVFVLGDNAYESGSLAEYNTCYGPTWGRHKARTRPVPGNHEYGTAGAAGYYTYFGSAGSPLETNCTSNCKGYYSYDLGTWHIVALNSEIDHADTSAQLTWLKADLAAHSNTCTLAYWHKPLFTSGVHGGDAETPSFKSFWDVLYKNGVDVVLNGHDHDYERFAPQNPIGQADAAHGIREFVVGTGGKTLRAFGTVLPNSELRNSNTFGVLKMTLQAGSYSWAFVPVAGQTFTDSGTANCINPS
jgi:parallel beta-helix repeat protein